MLELVEMELKDLLNDIGFDAEKVPFIHGSALSAYGLIQKLQYQLEKLINHFLWR